MLLATSTFAIALALIASERVDRTKVAMIGAAFVVVAGVIDQHTAVEAVEFEALGLLAGMMVAVRLTELTGVFEYLAIRAGQLAGARPLVLTLTLALATGILSAFLDNLTTVLLMVPLTFVIADALEFDPIPMILIEVFASNIGGTATLIGDPPNILIGAATGLSFGAFINHLAPVAMVTLVLTTFVLYAVYRHRLQIPAGAADRLRAMDPRAAITDAAELRRVGPLLVLTIVAFFVHRPLGLEPTTVALAGASLMLAVSSRPVEEALTGIDWPTLFFFIGLFVMVGALESAGTIEEIADAMVAVAGGDRTAELLGISWTSAIVGGIVDNIPLTAAMIPVVEHMEPGSDDAYWWVLAMGACFGGNLTLVSAAANVATAGMAARRGRPIGFLEFLRAGVPVTVGSMVVVTGYVLLRYA